MRSWARAFPPHPALMSPHLAAGGPSAREPGFGRSLPLGLVSGCCCPASAAVPPSEPSAAGVAASAGRVVHTLLRFLL